MDNLLTAPCIFCGHCGAGYYQTETHERYCPWYSVGGLAEREAKMRAIVKGALADRDAALAENAALKAELKDSRDDVEELTLCEDCGEDDKKLQEINAYPPRYCHSCRHKLVVELCDWRKRATTAEAQRDTAEARVAALTALLRRALPIVARTDTCFESEKDDLAEEIHAALRGAEEKGE